MAVGRTIGRLAKPVGGNVQMGWYYERLLLR